MDTQLLSTISMNGRMGYAIQCVEKCLMQLFPLKDWSLLSKKMWTVSSEYWDVWDEGFIEIIPEYLFEFSTFEESKFGGLSKEEYDRFIELYSGIVDIKDPKNNILNYLLGKLQDMEEVYCYTSIPGIGEDSLDIINNICSVLIDNGVEPPDPREFDFSKFSEKNGWGDWYDGEKYSLFLN